MLQQSKITYDFIFHASAYKMIDTITINKPLHVEGKNLWYQRIVICFYDHKLTAASDFFIIENFVESYINIINQIKSHLH
jgi:hypothetical protein